ncbi:hypothetical protein NV379_12430 [Paenibacillus sp. N1-5-1-14]|uniref:hypothetical protein n=1 Tax=Paenibacillus radicibacter TaxID=2972488 RepID=UPI002158EB28|nr:hypothetical protein [Paenibacillus radicibacter]MCR8643459.1 hypothetical protein [Paenibacillus radicibacter]
MHMAFLIGLPYYFLHYDRSKRKVSWIGQLPPQGSHVLLCEDIAGSGHTLSDCKNDLIKRGYSCSTLVACGDQISATLPDYSCFYAEDRDTRFILPWERHMLNSKEVHERPGEADHVYEHTGWDMDGVFLEDVDSMHYEANLENALAMRDLLKPALYAPRMIAPGDMIITGRPVIDKHRTLQWLNQHQYVVPVIFRDDGIEHPTAESTARWKGLKAIELSMTHYIESDAQQAAYIAAMYPELRVTWWNKGEPIQLQASPKVEELDSYRWIAK